MESVCLFTILQRRDTVTMGVCKCRGIDTLMAALCKCKGRVTMTMRLCRCRGKDTVSKGLCTMQGQRKEHLQVRDSSLQFGGPVDKIVASVDQPLVMQAHKCLQDRICSDTRGVSCAACRREGTACCMFAAVSVQENFIAAKQADQQM